MNFWMVLILRRIPNLYPYFLFILGIIVIGRLLHKEYANYFDLVFIIILLLQTIYLYQRKKSKRH